MIKLRVPDSHLDKGDVWVKCPKCGERFRPQRPDLESDLGLESGGAEPGPTPERRQAVEDIISRMNVDQMAPRGAEEFDRVLDAIPVLPETARGAKIFLGVTVALVAALLVGLVYLFRGAVAPPLDPLPPVPPQNAEYGNDFLLPDILALRKDLLRLRHVDRYIDYRGRESRVYKYFIPHLAPDLCQDVTQLHMWSPRTSEGFKLSGECVSPTEKAPTLDVRWDVRAANIRVEGDSEKVVELPLPHP
jgi:hypothetical protein